MGSGVTARVGYSERKVFREWLELSQYVYTREAIAGVDEVGRGALFGPVVAAAVILPAIAYPDLMAEGIQDSKKLSPRRRQSLAAQIRRVAIACQVGVISNRLIDRINILQASLVAMKRAVDKLEVKPSLVLVDGNQLIPNLSIPQQTIIKGDSCSLAIAAASIIAKVYRDEIILRLAVKYPMYDLARNKGYGSAKHLAALQEYGVSILHRKSFSPCQGYQQLDLFN